MSGHRLVALPEYDWEAVKIGAGPPPLRVPEGWLLLHHGVSGEEATGWEPQTKARYSAGGMLLDIADPSRLLARTAHPLLEPSTTAETTGTVPNVVFPTAVEEVDGRRLLLRHGRLGDRGRGPRQDPCRTRGPVSRTAAAAGATAG